MKDENRTTLAKPIVVWAAINPADRFALSCLYPSEEDAREDRQYYLDHSGWRLAKMEVRELS